MAIIREKNPSFPQTKKRREMRPTFISICFCSGLAGRGDTTPGRGCYPPTPENARFAPRRLGPQICPYHGIQELQALPPPYNLDRSNHASCSLSGEVSP